MESTPHPVDLESLLTHRAWVQAVARTLVRDAGLAADLEQEVWVEALKKPPTHQRALKGWLFSALKHNAIDFFRSEKRRRLREEAAAKSPETPSVADSVARAEAHKLLVVAVMDLPEPYRSTVLLRYFDDLKPAEIARRQSVPVETVRTRLKRAHERLRRGLDPSGREEGNSWVVALMPLLDRGSGAGPASASLAAVKGMVLMSNRVKVVVAIGLVALIGAGLSVELSGSLPPGPTRAEDPSLTSSTSLATDNQDPANPLADDSEPRVEEAAPGQMTILSGTVVADL